MPVPKGKPILLRERTRKKIREQLGVKEEKTYLDYLKEQAKKDRYYRDYLKEYYPEAYKSLPLK